MRCRGIRGATTVENNTREEILQATEELLRKLVDANRIDAGEVACVTFTTTTDLNAEFPALAARNLGWTDTALLCGNEMAVPGSLPKCIRVQILYNTDKSAAEMEHVYIRGAEKLRPDRVSP